MVSSSKMLLEGMDELLKITDNVSLALQALDKENGDDKSLGKGQDETLTCK